MYFYYVNIQNKKLSLFIDQVELLVMKALSLGLVRGSIDEIEQKCHMTWVQPRVLDRKQVIIIN